MKEQNVGINVLKNIAMFFIVLIHIIGWGGIITKQGIPILNKYALNFLIIMGGAAVNCYALASGYVNVKNEYKFSRIILLWLEVLFYSVGITVIYVLLGGNVAQETWKYILPFSGPYWYFNAYVILFLFMPILNKGITSITKIQHRNIIIMLLAIVWITDGIYAKDCFGLRIGESAIWIMIVYLVGAYFKLYGVPKKMDKITCILLYFITLLVAYILNTFIKPILFNTKLTLLYNITLLTNTSIFQVISAILIFMFFIQLKIKDKSFSKTMQILSKTSFGVYLIHLTPVIWHEILKNRYINVGYLPLGQMILTALGIAIGIYIICTIISWLRLNLFQKVGINQLIKNACKEE